MLLITPIGCSQIASSPPDVATGKQGYQEQHRPQFHFSPRKGWMNDPNGLVYYQGEYHLFYQYYPDATVWGPMHWGHAVSRDLMHWEHLPIALYPDSLGYIFSGSVVVDENNTAGFAPPGSTEKALVAIFTYHNMEFEKAGRTDRESQAIAYSLDRGRSWTKYAGNPVLPNKGDVDFRDPKVFWHEPSKQWIMPLAVGDYLEIFSSPNLKNWTYASTFGKNEGAHGGVWECPDLFPIKTKSGDEKWVLIQNMGRGAVNGGSGTQYFVGSFDGKTFKNDNSPDTQLWLDYGADNYAGVTYFGAPNQRRIFIGWMSNWDDYAQTVPTGAWRSSMTVPRELWLEQTQAGYRLFQKPVESLKNLHKNPKIIPGKWLDKTWQFGAVPVQHELDIVFNLKNSTARKLGFIFKNRLGERMVVGYDRDSKQFYTDRTASGKTSFSQKFVQKHFAPLEAGDVLRIRAVTDASSIELFINNGALAMSEVFFPNEDFNQLEFFSEGGKVQLMPSKMIQLKSIW